MLKQGNHRYHGHVEVYIRALTNAKDEPVYGDFNLRLPSRDWVKPFMRIIRTTGDYKSPKKEIWERFNIFYPETKDFRIGDIRTAAKALGEDKAARRIASHWMEENKHKKDVGEGWRYTGRYYKGKPTFHEWYGQFVRLPDEPDLVIRFENGREWSRVPGSFSVQDGINLTGRYEDATLQEYETDIFSGKKTLVKKIINVTQDGNTLLVNVNTVTSQRPSFAESRLFQPTTIDFEGSVLGSGSSTRVIFPVLGKEFGFEANSAEGKVLNQQKHLLWESVDAETLSFGCRLECEIDIENHEDHGMDQKECRLGQSLWHQHEKFGTHGAPEKPLFFDWCMRDMVHDDAREFHKTLFDESEKDKTHAMLAQTELRGVLHGITPKVLINDPLTLHDKKANESGQFVLKHQCKPTYNKRNNAKVRQQYQVISNMSMSLTDPNYRNTKQNPYMLYEEGQQKQGNSPITLMADTFLQELENHVYDQKPQVPLLAEIATGDHKSKIVKVEIGDDKIVKIPTLKPGDVTVDKNGQIVMVQDETAPEHFQGLEWCYVEKIEIIFSNDSSQNENAILLIEDFQHMESPSWLIDLFEALYPPGMDVDGMRDIRVQWSSPLKVGEDNQTRLLERPDTGDRVQIHGLHDCPEKLPYSNLNGKKGKLVERANPEVMNEKNNQLIFLYGPHLKEVLNKDSDNYWLVEVDDPSFDNPVTVHVENMRILSLVKQFEKETVVEIHGLQDIVLTTVHYSQLNGHMARFDHQLGPLASTTIQLRNRMNLKTRGPAVHVGFDEDADIPDRDDLLTYSSCYLPVENVKLLDAHTELAVGARGRTKVPYAGPGHHIINAEIPSHTKHHFDHFYLEVETGSQTYNFQWSSVGKVHHKYGKKWLQFVISNYWCHNTFPIGSEVKIAVRLFGRTTKDTIGIHRKFEVHRNSDDHDGNDVLKHQTLSGQYEIVKFSNKHDDPSQQLVSLHYDRDTDRYTLQLQSKTGEVVAFVKNEEIRVKDNIVRIKFGDTSTARKFGFHKGKNIQIAQVVWNGNHATLKWENTGSDFSDVDSANPVQIHSGDLDVEINHWEQDMIYGVDHVGQSVVFDSDKFDCFQKAKHEYKVASQPHGDFFLIDISPENESWAHLKVHKSLLTVEYSVQWQMKHGTHLIANDDDTHRLDFVDLPIGMKSEQFSLRLDHRDVVHVHWPERHFQEEWYDSEVDEMVIDEALKNATFRCSELGEMQMDKWTNMQDRIKTRFDDTRQKRNDYIEKHTKPKPTFTPRPQAITECVPTGHISWHTCANNDRVITLSGLSAADAFHQSDDTKHDRSLEQAMDDFFSEMHGEHSAEMEVHGNEHLIKAHEMLESAEQVNAGVKHIQSEVEFAFVSPVEQVESMLLKIDRILSIESDIYSATRSFETLAKICERIPLGPCKALGKSVDKGLATLDKALHRFRKVVEPAHHRLVGEHPDLRSTPPKYGGICGKLDSIRSKYHKYGDKVHTATENFDSIAGVLEMAWTVYKMQTDHSPEEGDCFQIRASPGKYSFNRRLWISEEPVEHDHDKIYSIYHEAADDATELPNNINFKKTKSARDENVFVKIITDGEHKDKLLLVHNDDIKLERSGEPEGLDILCKANGDVVDGSDTDSQHIIHIKPTDIVVIVGLQDRSGGVPAFDLDSHVNIRYWRHRKIFGSKNNNEKVVSEEDYNKLSKANYDYTISAAEDENHYFKLKLFDVTSQPLMYDSLRVHKDLLAEKVLKNEHMFEKVTLKKWVPETFQQDGKEQYAYKDSYFELCKKGNRPLTESQISNEQEDNPPKSFRFLNMPMSLFVECFSVTTNKDLHEVIERSKNDMLTFMQDKDEASFRIDLNHQIKVMHEKHTLSTLLSDGPMGEFFNQLKAIMNDVKNGIKDFIAMLPEPVIKAVVIVVNTVHTAACKLMSWAQPVINVAITVYKGIEHSGILGVIHYIGGWLEYLLTPINRIIDKVMKATGISELLKWVWDKLNPFSPMIHHFEHFVQDQMRDVLDIVAGQFEHLLQCDQIKVFEREVINIIAYMACGTCAVITPIIERAELYGKRFVRTMMAEQNTRWLKIQNKYKDKVEQNKYLRVEDVDADERLAFVQRGDECVRAQNTLDFMTINWMQLRQLELKFLKFIARQNTDSNALLPSDCQDQLTQKLWQSYKNQQLHNFFGPNAFTFVESLGSTDTVINIDDTTARMKPMDVFADKRSHFHSPTTMMQGCTKNCWFLAPLGALVKANRSLFFRKNIVFDDGKSASAEDGSIDDAATVSSVGLNLFKNNSEWTLSQVDTYLPIATGKRHYYKKGNGAHIIEWKKNKILGLAVGSKTCSYDPMDQAMFKKLHLDEFDYKIKPSDNHQSDWIDLEMHPGIDLSQAPKKYISFRVDKHLIKKRPLLNAFMTIVKNSILDEFCPSEATPFARADAHSGGGLDSQPLLPLLEKALCNALVQGNQYSEFSEYFKQPGGGILNGIFMLLGDRHELTYLYTKNQDATTMGWQDFKNSDINLSGRYVDADHKERDVHIIQDGSRNFVSASQFDNVGHGSIIDQGKTLKLLLGGAKRQASIELTSRMNATENMSSVSSPATATSSAKYVEVSSKQFAFGKKESLPSAFWDVKQLIKFESESDLTLVSVPSDSWVDTYTNLYKYIGYTLVKINGRNVGNHSKYEELIQNVMSQAVFNPEGTNVVFTLQKKAQLPTLKDLIDNASKSKINAKRTPDVGMAHPSFDTDQVILRFKNQEKWINNSFVSMNKKTVFLPTMSTDCTENVFDFNSTASVYDSGKESSLRLNHIDCGLLKRWQAALQSDCVMLVAQTQDHHAVVVLDVIQEILSLEPGQITDHDESIFAMINPEQQVARHETKSYYHVVNEESKNLVKQSKPPQDPFRIPHDAQLKVYKMGNDILNKDDIFVTIINGDHKDKIIKVQRQALVQVVKQWMIRIFDAGKEKAAHDSIQEITVSEFMSRMKYVFETHFNTEHDSKTTSSEMFHKNYPHDKSLEELRALHKENKLPVVDSLNLEISAGVEWRAGGDVESEHTSAQTGSSNGWKHFPSFKRSGRRGTNSITQVDDFGQNSDYHRPLTGVQVTYIGPRSWGGETYTMIVVSAGSNMAAGAAVGLAAGPLGALKGAFGGGIGGFFSALFKIPWKMAEVWEYNDRAEEYNYVHGTEQDPNKEQPTSSIDHHLSGGSGVDELERVTTHHDKNKTLLS